MAEPAAELAHSVGALAVEFMRNPARRHEWRDFYALFHRLPPVPIGDGEWVVTRWPDVRAAMGSSAAELTALYPSTGVPALNELMLGMLPYESGSRHRGLRRLTQHLLSDRSVAGLAAEIRREIRSALFPEAFTPAGTDVIGTLGVRLPEALSCLLLDVAPQDRERVGEWSRLLYAQTGRYDQSAAEAESVLAALDALRSYVLGRASAHDPGPGHGGVGNSLIALRRAGTLDDEQLIAYFSLFLLTGLDTITYAVGNALCFLGSRPDVFSTIRHSPELAGTAFSEVMRLWGPIRLCVRHLQRPVETPGGTIPEGALVFILIHAANRDPFSFADPDDLRWDRSGSRSIAFGIGPHGCLGGALGMLVGRVLFELLASECVALRATPDIENTRFIPSLPILGFEDVRIHAEPAG